MTFSIAFPSKLCDFLKYKLKFSESMEAIDDSRVGVGKCLLQFTDVGSHRNLQISFHSSELFVVIARRSAAEAVFFIERHISKMRAREPTVDRPIAGEDLPKCIANISNCGTVADAKIVEENIVKFDFCKISLICSPLSSSCLYPREYYM